MVTKLVTVLKSRFSRLRSRLLQLTDNGRLEMVSAEGIESALKPQKKNLTEHSWQTKALQVYVEQQTDFRNHLLLSAQPALFWRRLTPRWF